MSISTTMTPAPTRQDPRIALLKSAIRGVSPELIALCLSYLQQSQQSARFSQVTQFLDYFRTSNELELNPDDPLILSDLQKAQRILKIDPKKMARAPSWDNFMLMLDHTFALIAKTATFRESGLQVACAEELKWSELGITLTPSRSCNLVATQDTIYVLPQKLFWLMQAYSISRIVFHSNQLLAFVGLSEEESEEVQRQSNSSDVISRWESLAPTGYTIEWDFGDVTPDLCGGTTNRGERFFGVSSPNGMVLCVKEKSCISGV